MQKLTASQVISRVCKKSYPIEALVQTDEDPLVKQFEILKDREMNLSRKKTDLEGKLKNKESEITKFRLQNAELEQKFGVISRENGELVAQLKKYKNMEGQIEKDKDTLTRYEYQLTQAKEKIQELQKVIGDLTRHQKCIEYDMSETIKRFDEMMKSAKIMEGEIRIKDVMVKKLKKNLSSLKSYITTSEMTGDGKEGPGRPGTISPSLESFGSQQILTTKEKRVQTLITGNVIKATSILQQQQVTSGQDFMTEPSMSITDNENAATKIEVGVKKKVFSHSPPVLKSNDTQTPRSKSKSKKRIQERSISEESNLEGRASSRFSVQVRNRENPLDKAIKAKSGSNTSKNEDAMKDLVKEKEKITNFFLECGYMVHSQVQTKKINNKYFKDVKTKSVGTQRPTEDEKINEILDGVDAKSVAQTQLNLLVETLEKLKRNGAIKAINLTKEDIETIKEEMKNLIIEKANQETDNSKYIPANRTMYSGGTSFKTAGALNIGMKDPTLHYSSQNDTSYQPPPTKRKSKINGGVAAVRFAKKMMKKRK
ncbi:unnamed protein product [Moneuplotes crassus]|uniref:Uncharacterized protein n=1 Tax=Euplotes crassus TaxID=5936 RepID=A0AAD2CWR9_EUPCR|nr:unnamed protein product [Moneuplotes crassus]